MEQQTGQSNPLKVWLALYVTPCWQEQTLHLGSDLPTISWMVRHTAVSEKPSNHLYNSFGERVMRKDPSLQPAELRSSWGYGLWLGRSQTSNARLLGTRVGKVVARTIRRLPSTEREEASVVVAMRCTPVAGRPADAAAGDTVTRHTEEWKEVIVGPAYSGGQCKWAAAKASVYLHILTVTCLSQWSRGHNHRLREKQPTSKLRERERELPSHSSSCLLRFVLSVRRGIHCPCIALPRGAFSLWVSTLSSLVAWLDSLRSEPSW